jgi:hypothetical protein
MYSAMSRGFRRVTRQIGQGMTEYIIIVMVMAIGSIFVYTQFGDVLRNQMAAAAKMLAGQDGSVETASAQRAANAASTGTSGGMGFAGGGGGYGGSDRGSNSDNSDGSPGNGSNGDNSAGDGGTDVSAPETVPPRNIVDAPPGTPEYGSPLDDPAVLAIIAKSPTLQRDLERLKNDEWEILYDPNLGDVDGRAYPDRKIIRINTRLQNNPLDVVQLIAHEVGHVRNWVPVDDSTEDTFVRDLLLSEGEAVLYGIEIRREILVGSDHTINIGLVGRLGNHHRYYDVYNRLLGGEIATREAARQEIADIFGVRERVGTKTYEQHYRDQYREHQSRSNNGRP